MIKENQHYLNFSLVVIDILIILFCLLIAFYIRFLSPFFNPLQIQPSLVHHIKPLLYMVPIFLCFGYIFGLYRPQRYRSLITEYASILKTSCVSSMIFIMILYVADNIGYSRIFLGLFGLSVPVAFCIERTFLRFILRSLRKRGYNQKNILIAGLSCGTKEYLRIINANPQWGYDVMGILDNRSKKGFKVGQTKIINTLDQLDEILKNNILDEVIIALKNEDSPLLEDLIETCEKWGVFTRIIPDYFKFIANHPHIENLYGLPIISIREVPLHNIVKKVIKRGVDIIGALVGVLLFSPILLVITALVKLTSPGPIFFKQERVGLNKKNFMMLKFRSMVVQTAGDSDTKWTTNGDARVTPLGQFIRKTSLDELPQLLNVLKGDMSLIGPRPERPFFVDKFKDEVPKYMVKHQVRPGITGWAQVHGWRGDTSIPKRIEYDIYYIENWTLWMDMKIVLMTVFNGFINKNAY